MNKKWADSHLGKAGKNSEETYRRLHELVAPFTLALANTQNCRGLRAGEIPQAPGGAFLHQEEGP